MMPNSTDLKQVGFNKIVDKIGEQILGVQNNLANKTLMIMNMIKED